MDFEKILDSYRLKINEYLEKCFENKNGEIYDAMRYSLLDGGKRIRPVISLAVCEALGGNMEEALSFGCAIEMIHTYSLIHDDLPCMDNDDYRRGKPTNHKVFGETTAVLAGDALLNMACETLVSADFDKTRIVEALKVIYQSSGADGMVGGQMLDMKAEKESPDGEGLKTLHRKKTGALIDAAAMVGAISAGKDANILKEYSSSLGMAFQIRDDILDIEGNEEIIGKPIYSDEKNNKVTFITLYGIGGAKSQLEEETQKAVDSIAFLGEKGEFLRELAFYLLNRES